MELGRIVAVLLPGTSRNADNASGYVGNGSGYLLGRRLVLTARHVLDGRDSCEVQVPGGGAGPVRCAVVWRGGTIGGADVDAALLLAETDVREPVAPVRWGRLVTARHQPCDVAGYPEVGRRADGSLELQQPRATLAPGTGALSHRYTVELASSPPPDPGRRTPSPWSGQSGAALFCGAPAHGLPLLTGVVVTDVTGWGLPRWEAVPVYALLADPAFTDLVTRHTAAAPVWEPVDLQGLVTPATGWQVRSPATLLDQRAEVVRFHGREELLRELADEWCAAADGSPPEGGVRLAVVTGPGGAGKSRLARELSARMRDRHGWVCGWLDDRGPDGDHGVLAEVDRPLILVADYAELRIPQLTALLTALDRRPEGRPPVRLLLTARGLGDDTGGWWDQLRTRTRETRALTYDAVHRELPPLTGLPDRAAHYQDALTDLAVRLPQALPRALREATGDWSARVGLVAPRDVSAPGYGSALTLHMTALTDLLATHPATRPPDPDLRVEEQLLLHERAYWEDSAAGRPALAATGPVALADAVGTATLTAGAEPALARPLLRTSPGFRTADDTTVGEGTAWLAEMYPTPTGSCWGALQPDRLGEYHIGERTKADPDLIAAPLTTLATTHTAPSTPTGQSPRTAPAPPTRTDTLLAALVTVSRTGELPRHWEPVARALDAALTRVPSLAARVMQAATLTDCPDPLVEALHRLTDAPSTDPALLLELLDRLGAGRSRVLAEWATRTAATAVRALQPERRVGALVHEAVWRQAAGDHLAAVRRCEEALRLLDSGQAAAPPATRVEVLTLKARSQRWAGDFDPALVTLSAAEDLVERLPAGPDRDRASAELLGERARALTGRGEPDTARPLQERRVALLGTLAAATGDPALLERLADAEADLALTLNHLGRFREAADVLSETTAQSLDRLTEESPDAVDLDALGSLVGRANRLRAMDRMEESLKVARAALAVADRPESLGTPIGAAALAVILNNLGATLLALDRPQEALEPLRRGLAIRREQAVDAGEPTESLWSSLFQYSGVLQELGRYDEALEVIEECLAVSTDLVRRKLVDPRLEARTQIVLAEMLYAPTAGGRIADHREDLRRALKLVSRALSHYRRPLKNLPGDHLTEYAMALTAAVDLYGMLGRHRSRRHLSRILVSVRRILTHHDPEQHGHDLADVLTDIARQDQRDGRTAHAERGYAEAVAVRRLLLSLRGTATDRLALAAALAAYGGLLSADGRQHEALTDLREALAVTREAEPDADPRQYALTLATCHYNLADTLPWTGAFDEALREVEESRTCLAPLATLDPELYARETADCDSLQAEIVKAARHGLPERPRKRRRRS
ncbi:Tetratricopeptide repeat-containing protein [Streptomyces sp. yr375]|uniref:tetratricopeptide repeat protein n=1 Tax=Streptomyces sp. yr375 TaxID=1761906 RepID=UPI0008BE0F59|nr:tetratricopeptide repeat protein [Streptomyces sp. yr375]SES41808.1 Tetratricopeptide repeat-containing protein [Streptomyces sp. yr375]